MRVPQDPRWHPEGDALTHSLLAADLAAELYDRSDLPLDRREVVVLGALLHDVGKPATTRVRDGRITSRGHAEVGESLVIEMGARMGWPASLTNAVAALVRHHMAPVSVAGAPTRGAVRRLRARLLKANTSLEEWGIVVDSDGASRGPGAIPNRSEPWLRVGSLL
ncbi:HD domain-containing protein [Microbacterium albipurpureum]|uniref:HD domain-containing protein n=1 Tax=Microbacterium albipurpureum TaxID=3050384 RepID=UPI003BF542E9